MLLPELQAAAAFFEYHSRISYRKVENVASNQAIEHPSVRGCLQFVGMEEGVEIHHLADLPARTGLGTSSAFTVGLLLALQALKGRIYDRKTLAADAIHVEQELIKEAVGSQDQVCAAYGGFNRINFNTDGSIDVHRLLAPSGRLVELEEHLALYFTGFSRTASEIAQEQIRITRQKHRELELMREMVEEGEAIITSPKRPIEEFGRLLHDSWQIKKTLTQKISTPEIDELYKAGLSAGAVGGKLLGAGGGGFMLFFVPPEHRGALRARLQSLLCIPFKFSGKGSQVLVYEQEEEYDTALAQERDLVYCSSSPSGSNNAAAGPDVATGRLALA